MSGNGDMNAWIRQGLTPKHALEAFVGLLAGQDTDQDPEEAQGGTEGGQQTQDAQGGQGTPRRRVNADAGEGNLPENQPDAGATGHQAMNRLLKDAIRGKDRT